MKATAKRIPAGIFRLEKPLLALFLNRLFACDGSAFVQASGQARVSYASSSRELIREVQHLLLRFGILAKVREKPHAKASPDCLPWELEILDRASIETFVAEIGIFGKESRLAEVQACLGGKRHHSNRDRSEEHTSELQSRPHL